MNQTVHRGTELIRFLIALKCTEFMDQLVLSNGVCKIIGSANMY